MEPVQENQVQQNQIQQPATPTTLQQQPIASSPPPQKSNKAFLIGFVVLFTIVTAIMFYLMTKSNQNKNAKTENTTVSTPIPTQPQPSISTSPEEKEVESVDITDTAPTDFPAVENDIKGL